MRRIGGGHKRQLPHHRLQAQPASASSATVREIEYDPNRSARIALVEYADGEKRYILHPKGLKQGDTIVSGPGADSASATRCRSRKCRSVPSVHNIELKIGKGGQMARSAGAFAQVVAKEGEYVTLRMGSTEMRLVHGNCIATIGEVGNCGARAAVARQGGQEPLARQAPEGAW